jgi:hypothetical protein
METSPVIQIEADQPHADEWSAEHRKAHEGGKDEESENCKAQSKDKRANWEGKTSRPHRKDRELSRI